jgi:dihydrolipoamide dehydrogenase
MADNSFDLVVVGAGPGGYVAAIRAAQLGLSVACIEKEPALGGTCLRVGCIPSKAMLESSEQFHNAQHGLKAHGVVVSQVELDLATMLKRKTQIVTTLTKGIDALFKKNKVSRFLGHGTLLGPSRVRVQAEKSSVDLSAKHILIATGSRSAPLPGIELDGDRVGTSTEALCYPEVPKHLVVIGAGVIGLELGSVWNRLGSKVTVFEYCERILPGMDAELASDALKLFEKQGLLFKLGAKVTSAKTKGEQVVVEAEGQEPIVCDRVLLAVGRSPNTEGLGLQSVGIQPDARGRIPVDARFRTTAAGIYAIGDVIAGPMLAHKAEEEGIACVEQIVTGHGHVDYNTIPSVVYTHPEIASVGRTEEELKKGGIAYTKGVFPFLASGRARALGETEGRVKVLADAQTDRVLGVHILGAHAGDLIAEAAVAMSFHASAEDIARSCHAHPTLAEALKEAAMAVSNRAIHF